MNITKLRSNLTAFTAAETAQARSIMRSTLHAAGTAVALAEAAAVVTAYLAAQPVLRAAETRRRERQAAKEQWTQVQTELSTLEHDLAELRALLQQEAQRDRRPKARTRRVAA